MPAAAGALDAERTMPGQPVGPAWATAPAAQSASRRVMPKQSNAPAVASASSCAAVQPGPAGQVGHVEVRRRRDPRGDDRSARSSPIVRTERRVPSRTAGCAPVAGTEATGGAPAIPRSSVGAAAEALRRAAHHDAVPAGVGTSVCGE